MAQNPYRPPASGAPSAPTNVAKPSWLVRFLGGGLIGLILGLSSRPRYSAFPGPELDAMVRRHAIVYGGIGFLIGGGIGFAMYIARRIQDSKKTS